MCFLLVFFSSKAQKMTFGCQTGIAHINQKYVSELPNPEPFSSRLSYDFGFLLNYKMLNILQIQIELGFMKKESSIMTTSLMKDSIGNMDTFQILLFLLLDQYY
jgi:hypothetical protein